MNKRELKPGWKWVKLGDVATNYSKHVKDPANSEYERYVGSNNMERFDFRIRSWGDSSDITSSKIAFEAGDYLFVGRSLYASDFRERAARADFPGVCSNGILVIRENPEFIADGFLAAVLYHPKIWDYVIANGTGSLTRYIYWKQLANYEFPLPPVDEQRRIADLLWAADDAIQEKSNLMSSLLTLMDSLREEIFFSSDASKVKLQEIAEVRYGLGQPPPKTDSGVPLIRATNISQGQISKKDLLLVNPDDLPASRAIYLQEGDIILVRSGAYTGDSAMITGEWVNSIAGYDLVVTPNKEKIHPVFLAEFLLHKRTVKTILTPLSARSAQPHINAAQVGGIEMILPSMEIQLENIEKLNQVNQTIAELRNNTELLKKTKKLLLEQSLS